MKAKLLSLFRASIFLAAISTLTACSYLYDVIAVKQSDHIVFKVPENSPRHPSCLRRIEVRALDTNEIVWRDSVDHADDCSNEFPVAYGTKLAGRSEPAWPKIDAKTLSKEVVYEISTTTGATGYGAGIFMIDHTGRVLNGHEVPISSASSTTAVM